MTATRASTAAAVAKLDCDRSTIRADHTAVDGMTVWLGTTSRGTTVACVQPRLPAGASKRLRRLVRDRAVAALTGRCPRCDAAAGATAAGHVTLAHEPDCPIADPEDTR